MFHACKHMQSKGVHKALAIDKIKSVDRLALPECCDHLFHLAIFQRKEMLLAS